MEASAPWRPTSARRRPRANPDRLRVEPLGDRTVPAALLLATAGDVSGAGTPGLTSWTAGTALEFGGSSFATEPGQTTGTFSALFDLTRFTADARLAGLHAVTRPVTVGAGPDTFALRPGDLLLTVDGGTILTSRNTLQVGGDDVFAFRPQAPGDYSAGTFFLLLDNLHAIHGGNETRDIALVETDTVVGDVTLSAGSFLFARDTGDGENDVHLFVPTGVGAGATAGTVSVLIEGGDLGIGRKVFGVELVQAPTTVGGRVLAAGTLLLALDGDAVVGGTAVTRFDVFALTVTQTTLGSGTTAGSAALVFQGSDIGLDEGNEALRAVSLTAANNPPTAAPDGYATAEDTPLVVAGPGVLANDSDPDGDPLAAVLMSGPAHGTLALNPDGSFTYLPDPNYSGPDSFTYRVTDGQAESADVVVSLTVTPVNDPPVNTVPGPQATLAGENLILRAAVSVSDPDALGTDLFRVTLTATNGRVQLQPTETLGVTVVGGANNSATVTIEGTLDAINAVLDRVKFKPDLGYVGPAALTIISNDLGNRGGPPATDTDVIPIAVLPNLTPTLLDLDADDSSGAAGTGYQTTYNPGNPAVPVADPADAIILDPDSTTFASITVTLRDAPDGAGEVLAADTTGTLLTATYANGVLTISGEDTTAAFQQVLRTVTYRNLSAAPTPGDRTITFVVNDGYSDSNTAAATVTVNGRPVAVADSYTTGQNTPLTVSGPGVLANDSDPDGDPLTVTLVSASPGGTVVLNPDGSFTFTPDPAFRGTFTFTYRVSDPSGASATGTVTIRVIPPSGAPVALDDAYTVTEDGTLTVPPSGVLANDTPPGNLPLTARLVSGPANGTVTLNPDGSFTYTPDPDFSGTDSFVYRAVDINGTASGAARVRVTVTPTADPPGGSADQYTTDQDVPLTGNVLANDTDPDGDPLTAALVSGPTNGTVTLNPDGSFTYTPAGGFTGTDSFTYQVSDGTTNSGPVTVDITVRPTPPPPPPVPPDPEPPEEPPDEEPVPPPTVGNPPARPDPKPEPVDDPPTDGPGGTPGPGPAPVFTVPVGAVDLGPVGFISAPGDLAPAPVNLPAASVVPDPPVLPLLPTVPGIPVPPASAAEVPLGPILVPPPEVSVVPPPRVLPPEVEAALAAGLSELKGDVQAGVQARAVGDVAVATGVVAVAGYVFLTPKLAFWLLSALLARRTVWKPFDPLDVVYAWENDRHKRPPDDPDDESLESLVGEGKEP